MMERRKSWSGPKRRGGQSLIDTLVLLGVGVMLLALMKPSLATARRQSKYSVCLDRLATISAATAMYSAEDPTDMALPVHTRQYQPDPFVLGDYEYGGKSGRGRPDWVPGAGGQYHFLTSRYGTKAGFGPATRPLNRFLYPNGFADHLSFSGYNRDGAIADTKLQLEAFRCPSDDGPPAGGHCIDWTSEPEVTAFDFFGTSYHANVFLTSFVGGGPIYSNSPYMGPRSRVIDPERTLAFNEAIGEYAPRAKRYPTACSSLIGEDGIDPGPTKAVRGWHGKDWTYNRSFIDGHVATQSIIIEGTRDANGYYEHYRPEIVFPDDPQRQKRSVCIILRGDGWQVDTLPADSIPTGIFWDGYNDFGLCHVP